MRTIYDIYLYGSFYGYEWGTSEADAIRRAIGPNGDPEGFTAVTR